MTGQREAEDAAMAWIARLAAEDVSAGDQAAFDAWLRHDDRHVAAFEAMTNLWQALGPIARRRAQTAAAPVASRRWRARTAPLALAATLLLAAGAWLWIAAPQVVETAIGQQRSIALADGSRIELNTGTRIEIPSRGPQRDVRLLEGEAHFDVARDAARPFNVSTPHGTLRVLGTSFNVRLHDRQTDVHVFEGRVDARSGAAGTELSASEGAVLELDSAPVRRFEPPPSWRGGRLLYRDVTLAELIADLDRYLPVKLVLADDAPSVERITASLRLADQTEMLSALAEVVPLRYTQVNADLIIVRAG